MNFKLDASRLLNALTEWIEPLYGKEEARSIALMILERKFNTGLKRIVTGANIIFSEQSRTGINEILRKLYQHEPIQYILGEAYFYDRWLKVNPSVLIPRPETEGLCQLVIDENKNSSSRILDIGSGSGCIAVILAVHLNNCEIHGWDISGDAIEVAVENAKNNNVAVNFECRDIFQPVQLNKKFDIIVSNPPYVTLGDAKNMGKNVLEHEPHIALFAGGDPLEFYKSIIEKTARLLNSNGMIYLEINESYGNKIRELLNKARLNQIRIIKDLHGKARFAFARYSE